MKSLQGQIIEAISPIESESGLPACVFSFPGDFVGFQGHFPDNPVLPGICMVQTLVALSRTALNADVSLLEIKEAKFLAAVTSNEECRIECTELAERDDGATSIKARILRNDEIVAKITLLAEVSNGTK